MTEAAARSDLRVLTVGHSNHDEQTFVKLLLRHGVEVLVDVRSQPYSKYNSQFNAGPIKPILAAAGIQYLFLGAELGGRPADSACYDEQGRVLYERVASSAPFLQGVERLEETAREHCVALLCGEEDPLECHRNLLVGRVLTQRGVDVRHIRGDGRVQTSAEVEHESRPSDSRQQYLFPEMKETPWRSTRSVAPKPRQPDSSEN